MDGKHCPACGKDIGLLAVLRAPLPNVGIRCPHCRAGLKYVPGHYGYAVAAMLAYFSLLYLLSPLALAQAKQSDPNIAILLAVLVCVLLWQPFEFILTALLRTRATLHLKQSGLPPVAPPPSADNDIPPGNDTP